MLSTLICGMALAAPPMAFQKDAAPGCLQILDKEGKSAGLCPLAGTKVEADIAGFGARVVVRQTFTNPSKEAIEAVYTFPLPADAAVDRMNMRIGDRLVEGEIKRREEARRIYDAAKNAGQAAALLDQERPNIFTQSVANITPGAKIEIEISYVQLLKFEEDKFEFNFPMVVGPRFTGVTPDPGKVTPPITPKGTRTGATIDLTVRIDAGARVTELESELHQIEKQKPNPNQVVVKLAKRDEIPNRDFILKYGVASNTVQSAMLSYADQRNGGFFTLILMPPKAPTPEQIVPREMILVVDQSGSQSGFPIIKSRELCNKMIDALRPGDTFNVMGFNNVVNPLWGEPRENTGANRALAHKFVSTLEANGGTMLNQAIQAAMKPKVDAKRVRIILFNTDGFVGDDFNILDSIQKYRQSARIFTFGIGSGVNRFLIDAMSNEGKGDSEIVTLEADTDKAVDRFLRRTQSPVLTNIEARFEGVTVVDQLPSAIPDVFSEKPVIIKGRYTEAGKGKVIIRGMLGDSPWQKEVALNFPATPTYASLTEDLREPNPEGLIAGVGAGQEKPANLQTAFGGRGSAIATLWAREMIDDVMRSNWMAMYSNLPAETRTAKDKMTVQAVVNLGLRFGLMTQYTSFVAVEKRVINIGGKQRTVAVPVEMTDGVSYEGIFGADRAEGLFRGGRPASFARSGGFGGGAGGAASMPAMKSAAGVAFEAPSPGTSQPVRRLKIRSADPAFILALSGGPWFNEADGSLSKKAADGKMAKVAFKDLKDDEVIALALQISDEAEKKLVKTLKPDEAERYWYLVKVDRKLREAKDGTIAIQIWISDWKAENIGALKGAGLTEVQPQQALKVVIGSCDKATLKKLASLSFVKQVVPLEG